MQFKSSQLAKESLLPFALILLIALVAPLSIHPVQYFHPGTSNQAHYLAQTTNQSFVTEFPLSQPQDYPLGLAVDSSGNVWFSEANADSIVEFIPSTQSFRSFHIPIQKQLAFIWTPVFDNNGNLWFSTTNGSVIWRLDPSTGQFANFSTENTQAQPYNLAYDPNSNQIWFCSLDSNQFGVFQLDNGSATIKDIYNIPTTKGLLGASDIALDQKGNVYVADSFVGQIAKFSESDGSLEHIYSLPNGGEPLGLAIDPTTNDIWFTNHASSNFGYINQTSGGIEQFSTSTFTFNGSFEFTLPYWIQISSSGMIWLNEHIGDRIARFDPKNYQLTEFPVPTSNAEPIKFVLDNQRGLVWFSEFTGNKIGMIEQNSSSNPMISLSNRSVTLSGNSVEITALNPSNSSLVFSSTATVTGELGDNFTTSVNSQTSPTKITINRGSSLKEGTYQLTICSSVTIPARSCGVVSVIVQAVPSYFPSPTEIEIATAAIVVTLGLSLYFVRKWNSHVH